jgi:hypothetical protein
MVIGCEVDDTCGPFFTLGDTVGDNGLL